VGVGDSLEFPYDLPGPLPAGTYAITVDGYEASADAHIHFELALRTTGMPDQSIGSTDARADDADAGVTMGAVRAAINAPAVNGRCHDSLVLKVKVASGGSSYLEFLVGMTTP
jgi:hypothetical protein